ncbi:MAG TPA: hypothetical protein VH914_21545 [Acidimicrobiia bacterium]|jgi:hypothetical protein|nr:hypothetical protein [Acidimicrobiia bacterium]
MATLLKSWLVVAVAMAAGCGSPHERAHTDAGPVAAPDAAVDAAADAARDAGSGSGSAADPFAAIQQMPGLCSSYGWCWLLPTPSGNDFDNVFATDAGNVWITGWELALQWDGRSWTSHTLPVDPSVPPAERVFSIAGTSAHDMWLTYGTSLEHWDGSQWTIVESQPLSGSTFINTLWSAPDTGDLYATLSTGVVERWHAGTRSIITGPCACFLGKIWGTSSTDIYLTTIGGEWHYNNDTSWTELHTGDTLAGWMGAPGDVWVSGDAELAHYDGSAFTVVALPAGVGADQPLLAAGYVSSSDVSWYTPSNGGAVLHWDGSVFTLTPVSGATEPSVLSAQIIGGTWWITGRSSALYTMHGTSTLAPVLATPFETFEGMWGTEAGDLFFADDGELFHWDGFLSDDLTGDAGLDTGHFVAVQGLTGDSLGKGQPDELFASAQEQLDATTYQTVALHFDGSAWSQQVIETGTRDSLVGLGLVDVVGPGEAWAFTASGTSRHFVGGAWQDVATTPLAKPLTSFWAQDATHVWLVGQGRAVMTWDAANPTVFTPVAFPAAQCTGPEGQLMELGQVVGVGGLPWIPSDESCKGVAAMWELGASGWTEVTEQVLGDGSVFHVNPVTEAANGEGGLVAISPTNLVFSNAGDTSTYRFDGTVWNYEDTGSEFGTPHVFATQGGAQFVAAQSHGILVHP